MSTQDTGGLQVQIWPRGRNRKVTVGPLGIAWPTAPGGAQARAVVTPVDLSDVGELLSVDWSSRYETGFGGDDVATVKIRPFTGHGSAGWRPGDPARIIEAGGKQWDGEYSEADPTADDEEDGATWTLKFKGTAYDLDAYPCTRFTSQPGDVDIEFCTRRADHGITNARERWGLAISQLVGVNGLTAPAGSVNDAIAVGVVDESPRTIREVLTEAAADRDQLWAVWGRTLIVEDRPTVPQWLYPAPRTVLALADTDAYSSVGVWFPLVNSSSTGIAWATDTKLRDVMDDRRVVVDYRDADWSGLATSSARQAAALNVAQRLLARVGPRYLVTGSLTLQGDTSGLTSPTGGVAALSNVRAGQVLALTGLRNNIGNLVADGQNMLIGRAEHRWSAESGRSVTLTPSDGLRRDLTAALNKPADKSKVSALGRLTPPEETP